MTNDANGAQVDSERWISYADHPPKEQDLEVLAYLPIWRSKYNPKGIRIGYVNKYGDFVSARRLVRLGEDTYIPESWDKPVLWRRLSPVNE